MRMGALLLPASAALILAACGPMQLLATRVEGSGRAAADPRTVGPFQRVQLNGAADLVITVGADRAVVVKADDNLLDVITTTVEGDTLVIGKANPYHSRSGVEVTVSVPDLTGLELYGSGDVTIGGVRGARFDVSVAGSGDVEATGSADEVSISVSGSGDVDLLHLAARHGSVTIVGSGDVALRVADSLDVSITGSGNVVYAGTPAEVSRRIVGSGSVSSTH